MKIIKFTAENVKRLKAVEITPDGTIQVVAGRNAQGKSSVLDAIWLALGGGAAARATARPIRDGEDTASVTLDLGDLVVTRTWKGDKTTLTVKSADGAKFSSPQAVLDGLVGRLSFDPLEFTRRTPAEQRDALLSLVDLPFDPKAVDAQRVKLYDDRTEIGRKRKALGSVPSPNNALPVDETSASELLTEIRTARNVERQEVNDRAAVGFLVSATEQKSTRIADLTKQIAELTAELKTDAKRIEKATAAIVVAPEGYAEELEARLTTIEESNEAIRANNRAREIKHEDAALHEQYCAVTDEIDELDRSKAEGLAAAVFPVEGLGFDESGVTYKGIPFSQASSAEQIQVSLAMAMSLNPRLRVIRIMDGSLLDADSLALISTAATDADYQVWIERVGDGGEGGVVIEDGEIEAGGPS